MCHLCVRRHHLDFDLKASGSSETVREELRCISALPDYLNVCWSCPRWRKMRIIDPLDLVFKSRRIRREPSSISTGVTSSLTDVRGDAPTDAKCFTFLTPGDLKSELHSVRLANCVGTLKIDANLMTAVKLINWSGSKLFDACTLCSWGC